MKEEWYEKIEDYLNGSMSPEEQSLFESELATNEELLTLFNLYRTIEEEMRDDAKSGKEDASLRNSLGALNEKYFEAKPQEEAKQVEKERTAQPAVLKPIAGGPEGGSAEDFRGEHGKVRRITTWRSLAVAAVTVGLVSLGVLWYTQNEKDDSGLAINDKKNDTAKNIITSDTGVPNVPSNQIAKQDDVDSANKRQKNKIGQPKGEALFAHNFMPDTAPTHKPPSLQRALASYENKQYKDAIEGIRNPDSGLVTRGPKEDKKLTVFYTHYYMALSHIADSNTVKAIPELQNAIKKSPDKFLKSKAQWYLALAYLKVGEVDKAEVLLKQITNNYQAGEYKQKAVELRDELGKEK